MDWWFLIKGHENFFSQSIRFIFGSVPLFCVVRFCCFNQFLGSSLLPVCSCCLRLLSIVCFLDLFSGLDEDAFWVFWVSWKKKLNYGFADEFFSLRSTSTNFWVWGWTWYQFMGRGLTWIWIYGCCSWCCCNDEFGAS